MFQMFIRTMCSTTIKKKPPIPVFGLEGRYVSALYSAASQNNELELVENSLNDFQTLLTRPKVVDFIATSLIPRPAKAKLLMDIAKQAGMPSTAVNFLGLVAENGRLKQLRRMINLYHTVMVAHRNEALCEVITAEPLDSSTKQALTAVLQKFVKSGKNIQITEKISKDIIGGVIVGFENKHVDLSIARSLNKYRELLKQPV
ncbi:ATP synthase subunit O, mitochondrial-like [Spodoptera frugiperda]|uniref:Oligomycin sensitivity conferral protein n=1 Tax=Spodoptera frugiperda TaxID=7108 RepID=A0A9R0E9N1_SPOFR|nr:ATP synthase subunit O, mitochondrial-like [Spodoptera frugiperda]